MFTLVYKTGRYGWLGFLLFVMSCAGPKRAQVQVVTPEPVLTLGREEPRAWKRLLLLQSPHALHDDFSYPRYVTRQIFAWGSFGGLWRLNFPERQYVYGGFEFRDELDVSNRLDELALTFRVQPAEAARYLRVGLAGYDAQNRLLMTDTRLEEAYLNPGRGGSLVSIRLSEFPKQAQWLEGEGHALPPMDWGRLRQMRLISTDPERPALDLSITHLQLGPIPAFRK